MIQVLKDDTSPNKRGTQLFKWQLWGPRSGGQARPRGGGTSAAVVRAKLLASVNA